MYRFDINFSITNGNCLFIASSHVLHLTNMMSSLSIKNGLKEKNNDRKVGGVSWSDEEIVFLFHSHESI